MLVYSCYVLRAMGVRFQTAKVIVKVTEGHWQWCHSIDHIRFPIATMSLSSNVSNYLKPPHFAHFLSPFISSLRVEIETSNLLDELIAYFPKFIEVR